MWSIPVILLFVSAEGQANIFLFHNVMVSLWEQYSVGVVGEFRRAMRKLCGRRIIRKQVGCSLLCINNRICSVYTLVLLQDSLACVAGTYWVDHQRSHWRWQPYMTQTFTWMNCSWAISSKVLGTNSPFTYFTSGGYRCFFNFLSLDFFLTPFSFFHHCCWTILLQSLQEIVRLWFLSGLH